MIGVQVPRVESVPEYDSEPDMSLAHDLLDAVGVKLDSWQERILRYSLCKNCGRWAASRVCLSVPRQSGKTLLACMRELIALFALPPGSLIIHSAHLYDTASESFFVMKGLFDQSMDPDERGVLADYASDVHDWQGDRSIQMKNGTRIKYSARKGGKGRGFSCDLLVLDEVQELSPDTWGDIMPTVSARPNAQIWLMGTPPSPKMNGEVFGSLRDAGIRGDDSRLYYGEFSATREMDPSSPETWAVAIPALGTRVHLNTVTDEYNSQKERMLDQFLRERLGIWDENPFGVFNMERWRALAEPEPPAAGLKAFAVDMNPDRSQITISAALKPDEGRVHVEVVASENVGMHGTAWVVDWLAERWAETAAVVIDGQSPAASLVPDLIARKVRVTVTSAGDMMKACGRFYDGYRQGDFTHFNQQSLNDAVAAAKRRDASVGGAFSWDRKSVDADITCLVSATLALWGVETTKRRPGRKAKVSF